MSTSQSVNNGGKYWCHKCKKRITPNLEDFSCPTCHDPFIEEIEDESELMQLYGNVQQNQQPQQQPPLQQSPLPRTPTQPFPFLFGMPPAGATQQQPMDPFQQLMQQLMAPGFMGNPLPPQAQQNNQQQPRMRRMNFLDMMDEIFNVAGGAGGGLQFGLGGGGNGGGQFGDYFVGNIDQLLSRLAEQFNGPIGTPPASKKELEKLEKYEITAQDVEKHMECAVCQEKYQEKEKVIKMPCTHMFHEACLMPWLELHNSCPTCRFELPTDDKEYEERKKQGNGAQNQQQRPSPAGGQSSSQSRPQPAQNQQQQNTRQQQQQQPQFFNPFFQFFGGPPGNNNNNRRPPGSGSSGGGSPSYII